MSAEQISIADFFQSSMDMSGAHGDSMMAAFAAFQTNRRLPEDRTFDKVTAKEIAERYTALRRPNWTGREEDLEYLRDRFLSTVEIYGNGLASICAGLPPGQDERRDKVRQLAGALQKLQDILVSIDSGALAQTLNEMDKALNDGKAMEATDPASAFILAGQVRVLAGQPLSALIVGAANAAKVLDEPDYDPILEVIWQLERLFDDHGLAFEAKDKGFAAECFQAIYELANPGKSKDRPKYLLNKAISDPRSWANFKNRP